MPTNHSEGAVLGVDLDKMQAATMADLKVREATAVPHPAATLDQLLGDRGKRYGKFAGHAACSQRIKQAIFSHVPEGNVQRKLTASQMEALEMIAHKIARIMNGDPNYADSWRDIAGYATLEADILEGKGR